MTEAKKKRAPAKKSNAAPKAKVPDNQKDLEYSGGAMFERRMGELLFIGAAGAAGIWLVLILIGIGVVQNL